MSHAPFHGPLRLAVFGALPAQFETIVARAARVKGDGLATSIDAALVLPGASAQEAVSAMARSGNLLAALLDLSGGESARADHGGRLTADNLSHALDTAERLRHERATLAPIVANDDAAALTLLGLAVTRGRPIDAQLTPHSPDMVHYPLLTGLEEPASLLESLAAAKLLKRRYFERLYTCSGCNSSRTLPREVCPQCRSSDLSEDSLVHHYKCGHQGPKSTFLKDKRLICPKCDGELRHYGVDYDTPGTVRLCGACHAMFSEPEIGFLCADCDTVTRGIDIKSRTWHHYDLTPAAHNAAFEGRLPGLALNGILTGLPGWRSPRDFALLVDFNSRVASRYKRPYAVLQLDLSASTAAAMELGSSGIARLQQALVDVISETIRVSDFLAVFDNSIILLLPEVPPENCTLFLNRIKGAVDRTLGDRAQITPRTVPPEEIPILVDLLSKG